jgi:hypothetical protein
MSISIIKADLIKDKQTIINIFNQNRDHTIDSNRFDWLYSNNPAGKAVVWLAVDDENDRYIGAAAALPRDMRIKGEIIKCHVLSDFSIDQKYRSLGPAIKLNRSSITPALEKQIPFSYDFPSKTMAAAHRWLKFEPIGKIIRFVRPLQAKSQLKKIPLIRTNLFSTVINNIIKNLQKIIYSDKLDKAYSFEELKITESTFDSEFTRLDSSIGPKFTVCGVRNKEYLNWRYGQNPIHTFYLIKLLRKNTLCGYAIFYFSSDKRVTVFDLYSDDTGRVGRNLIAGLLLIAKRQNIETIEISLLSSNPWISILKKYGFISRPSLLEVFTFLSDESPLNGIVDFSENWYMTNGDRDT